VWNLEPRETRGDEINQRLGVHARRDVANHYGAAWNLTHERVWRREHCAFNHVGVFEHDAFDLASVYGFATDVYDILDAVDDA
jgi:hypothetical protein